VLRAVTIHPSLWVACLLFRNNTGLTLQAGFISSSSSSASDVLLFLSIHQHSKPLFLAEKGTEIDRKRGHPSSHLDFS
jgi:hypothetical protein